jgi:hypothetical protein
MDNQERQLMAAMVESIKELSHKIDQLGSHVSGQLSAQLDEMQFLSSMTAVIRDAVLPKPELTPAQALVLEVLNSDPHAADAFNAMPPDSANSVLNTFASLLEAVAAQPAPVPQESAQPVQPEAVEADDDEDFLQDELISIVEDYDPYEEDPEG